MADAIIPAPKHSTPSRSRDISELAISYGLILLVIWTPRPEQRWFYITAAADIVIILFRSFRTPQQMGLRTTNFVRSSWIIGVALLLSVIAIALAAWQHTLLPFEGPSAFLRRYWGYALWSFAQQILLQDFFLQRLRRLLPTNTAAVLASAGIFALAHLPNPILTIVTLIMGLAACTLFLRYRNLYPLSIAHAILGITLAITVPGPVIRNMRVGLGYLTYPHHHLHYRNHSSVKTP